MTAPAEMSDPVVRAILREKVLKRYYDDSSSRVVEEMTLCREGSRIDVAVINGSLHGYEIKSEKDTFVRLKRQAAAYNEVFDFVTLVVNECHLKNALKRTPKWWEVCVVRDGDVQTIRAGTRNSKIVPFAVARLLWRDEALAILRDKGISRGLESKPRRVLWESLASALPLDELQLQVREALKLREGWLQPS